jgi:hypothetical protein
MQSALKNDWLHPNADGYKFLGQHVPLSLFTTTNAVSGRSVPTAGGVAGYELKAGYSNPFHSTVTIPFEIPRASFVSLKLFSTDGKEVAQLAGKTFSSGSHAVEFATASLSNGVYFYTIQADGFHATRKIHLQGM